MKKILASALAVLMLLSAMTVTAFAANGPSSATWDDSYYLAYISLYNYDGAPVNYGVFNNNTIDNEAIKGASYDRKTNTLTLKDFNHPELHLETNMMGDDFKLKVSGACSLSTISVWGDGYGGSLLITGSGTLNVNTDSAANYAVTLYPENCTAKLAFDGSVKANLYGSKGVAAIIGANKNDSGTGFAFADGKGHSVESKAQVEYNPKYVVGYLYENLKDDTHLRVGFKAHKNGDSSLYAVTPYYSYPDSDEITSYGVKKVVYSKKFKMFFTDISYNSRELSSNQFNNEGFVFEYEDKQQEWPESIMSDYNMARIRCAEYTVNGKKYYKWNGGYVVDDVDKNTTVLEAAPLTGVDDEYLFTKTSDSVDLNELTATDKYINGYYLTEKSDNFVGQKAVRKSDPNGIYTYAYYTVTGATDGKTEGYEVIKLLYLEDLGVYIRDTSFGDYNSYYGCSFYGSKDMTVAEWEASDFEPYYPVITEKAAMYNPGYENNSVFHQMPVYTDKNGKEYCVKNEYTEQGIKQTVLNMEKIDELDNAYWLTVNTKVKPSDLTETGSESPTGNIDYTLSGFSLKYVGNGSSLTDASKTLNSATITGIKTKTYTGKALTQSPKITLGGKTLKKGTDYTLSYKNNVNAGKATLIIKGKGSYTGAVQATFTIAKASNPITLTYVKSVTAKANTTVKGVIAAKKAQGAVTYKTNNKNFTVKGGKLTIAKGTKKGKYTVKVTVIAKGNSNYNKANTTVKVKVKVK